MHFFKIYLYKSQIKTRNSFICLLLFRFLEVFVLVLFLIFFLLFLVRLRRAFFFWKTFEFEKKFCKIVQNRRHIIDVILFKNFCTRNFHVDNIKYHYIKIFFSNLFLIILFIFTFSVNFSSTFIFFSSFFFTHLLQYRVAILNN